MMGMRGTLSKRLGMGREGLKVRQSWDHGNQPSTLASVFPRFES